MLQNNSIFRIASYNVGNLNVNDRERLNEVGNHIGKELGCPSIVGLVEIEDDIKDTSESDELLDSLCRYINARYDIEYSYSYIGPRNGCDGGKPRCNVKQAILYDSVLFHKIRKRGNYKNTYETGFPSNPCRIGNCAIFNATRKPFIAKLGFRDTQESIVVIVNHFKSENVYFNGAKMPSSPKQMRQGQAEIVAKFANEFKRVLCLGDFNDVPCSITYDTMIENSSLGDTHANLPDHNSYTFRYKGKRMKLDYIFASPFLMSCFKNSGILHLNTNKSRMYQASDHDPLYAEFDLIEVML